MSSRPRVSVILPAYNEEGALGGVLDAVNRMRDRYDLEVIVVEGGSKDRTVQVAREHGATKVISSREKRGKGADFWTGVLSATGDYIIQIDTDHQFEPQDIPQMVDALLAGAEMAIATRFVQSAHLEAKSVRPINMFGNWLFSWLTTVLTGQRITDCLAGFKGFRKELIPYLQIRSPHFGYEVELIIRAARARKKIVEVPVTHHRREQGVTNVRRWKDGALILGSLLEAWVTPLRPSGSLLPGVVSFPARPIPEEAKKQGRWLSRIHPLAWVFLLVFLLYAPSLIGGKLQLDADNLTEGYVYAYHFSQFPLQHDAARYTNAYHGGANVSENPVFAVYGWLFTFKPSFILPVVLFHWLVFFGACVFVWAAYVFFRDRGFEKWIAAGLVALVFFSARYQLQVLQPLYVFSYFVTPALCVILDRLAKRFSWKTVIVGGVVSAAILLFSYIGLLILFAVVILAYALFQLYGLWMHHRPAVVRYALGLLLMAAIGLGLSWWHLEPTYRMAQDTPRGIGLTYAASQEETIRFFDLPRVIFPQWKFGASSEGELFVGLIGLSALIAACVSRSRTREDRFWMWTLLLTLAFAWEFSPLSWLANRLPLFESLRAPSRMLFVAILALAYLAGRGIQSYLSHPERLLATRTMRTVRGIMATLVIVGVCGSLFGLLNGYAFLTTRITAWFDQAYYARTRGLPLEHYHDVIRGMVADLRLNVDLLMSPYALLVVITAACLWVGLSRRRPPVGPIPIAVLLMVTGGAFGFMRTLPLQTVSAAVLDSIPASAQFIRSQPDAHLYRMFTLWYGSSKYQFLDTPLLGRASPADQIDFFHDLMPVNSNRRYGLQSIDGYDNFMTRRTANALPEVLSETIKNETSQAASRLSPEEKTAFWLRRLPVLGMMNVKYVLSVQPLEDPRLTVVWEGETTRHRIPFRIYENAEVLPRVFLANQVLVIPEDEQAALREVLAPARDFHAQTILECGDCVIVNAPPDASDQVEVRSYVPGSVHIHTTTTRERVLVFNETRLRGWSAWLDGEPVPTFYANSLFQAVIVPAGTHEVRFFYDRPS